MCFACSNYGGETQTLAKKTTSKITIAKSSMESVTLDLSLRVPKTEVRMKSDQKHKVLNGNVLAALPERPMANEQHSSRGIRG